MESKLIAGVIIALIIGIIIGYGGAMVAAPGAQTVTTTVTTGAATVTTTVTAPGAGGPGLTGEVTIGALLTLTGDLASYGENSKVAIEYAEQEVNQWLSSIGAGWSLKVRIEDTATDPKTAADKIRILHAAGIKIVVGPMTSAEVSEIKSYADTNQILVVSQSSTSPALSIPDDFIFRFCPDDTIQGPAAARILFDLGVRYVIPVWRGDTWGDGVEEETAKAFRELLQKEGVEGDWHEGIRYAPGAKEFSVEVAQLNDYVTDWISKYGADKVGIYYVGFDEASIFAGEATKYDALKQVVWVGSDGTAGVTTLVEQADAAAFSWEVKWLHPIFAPTENPKYFKLRDHVMNVLGREPDAYAYAAYDAVWVIAISLNMVQDYDPVKVKAVLPQVVKTYMGASGYFELNENGDRAYSDYTIMIVRKTDGEYKWDVAGVWRYTTDTIEWAEWFKAYLP